MSEARPYEVRVHWLWFVLIGFVMAGKLCGEVTAPWWLILLPFWGPIALFAAVLAGLLLFAVVIAILEAFSR